MRYNANHDHSIQLLFALSVGIATGIAIIALLFWIKWRARQRKNKRRMYPHTIQARLARKKREKKKH